MTQRTINLIIYIVLFQFSCMGSPNPEDQTPLKEYDRDIEWQLSRWKLIFSIQAEQIHKYWDSWNPDGYKSREKARQFIGENAEEVLPTLCKALLNKNICYYIFEDILKRNKQSGGSLTFVKICKHVETVTYPIILKEKYYYLKRDPSEYFHYLLENTRDVNIIDYVYNEFLKYKIEYRRDHSFPMMKKLCFLARYYPERYRLAFSRLPKERQERFLNNWRYEFLKKESGKLEKARLKPPLTTKELEKAINTPPAKFPLEELERKRKERELNKLYHLDINK